MIRKVYQYPNPVLETMCDPVPDEEFNTADLRQLVDDMFETMYEYKGVGLAAPQIGVLKRIAVIDISFGEEPEKRLEIINPQIVRLEGKQRGEEGCLCFPGFRENVTRATKGVIRFRDVTGAEHETETTDLLTRAFQHEIDHLDGILFIRHVSALKRDLIRRKIRKLIKAGEWD